MKSVIVLSIALLSLNSFALDANSSWTEIFASRKTNVQLPQVSFAAGEVTSFLSVEKLCYTETAIKTIQPQDVFVHGGGEHGNISATGKEILSTSRVYTMMIPVGEHGPGQAVVMSIPIKYNIIVLAASYGDRDSNRVLFTKALNLPACQ